jgi:hypothetical protein
MVFDSELGWVYKPNLKINDFSKDQSLSTNLLGYRNQFEFSPSHNNIVFLLGDSFVFGDESSNEEVSSYLLNSNSKKHKFYNLGVSGYGHDQMLVTFERYVEKYKPVRTILFFNFTDLHRNILSFHDYFKPYYTWEDDLLLHTSHIVSREQAISDEFWRLKFLEFIPIMLMRRNYNSKEYNKNIEFITSKILERMLTVANNNNSKLNIIYIPIAHEANAVEAKEFGSEKFMFSFCKQNNIECSSARAAFRKIKNDSGHIFKEQGHWREQGHRAVYETVRRIMGPDQ